MPTNDLLSKFDANGYWSVPKPNWGNWTRKSKCKLWEAVALACDVDPGIYLPYGLTAESAIDDVLTSIPANVRSLIDLAKIAVGSGTLKISPIVDTNLMRSEVGLAEFTTWFQVLGHIPPDEYPWVANELKGGQMHWPWGIYQTKALEHLALAVDRFWKNFDPRDHSTAPKNATVIAWLEERGISNRQADAIASLLRADNCPQDRADGK